MIYFEFDEFESFGIGNFFESFKFFFYGDSEIGEVGIKVLLVMDFYVFMKKMIYIFVCGKNFFVGICLVMIKFLIVVLGEVI